MATRIAITLMGKHKPLYLPHADCGDHVVVTNAAQLAFTGRKLEQKVYYKHSTRPGSLTVTPLAKLMATDPSDVVRRAVRGMLPKDRLRDKRMKRLRVFDGPETPYQQNIARSYVKF